MTIERKPATDSKGKVIKGLVFTDPVHLKPSKKPKPPTEGNKP